MAALGWELVYLDTVVAHHHPQPGAHREGRRRLVTRNDLLTTLMRRPWPVVAREWLHAAASGGEYAAGAGDALLRIPAALRMRKRLPGRVEKRVRLLQH